jgi:hypothetical protein
MTSPAPAAERVESPRTLPHRSPSKASIDFCTGEVDTYFRVRVPSLRKSGKHWRGRCPIHGGERLNLSIDSETGAWYCFSGCAGGGDLIAFEMRLTGARYPEAVRSIGEIIGRDLLTDTPQRPKHSQHTLSRAELLVVGLAWRIERNLDTAKRELDGPERRTAEGAVRTLTEWLARIRSWHTLVLRGDPRSPSAYWEGCFTAAGMQAALLLLRRLPRGLVDECVHEAQEAYDALALLVCGMAQREAAA